MKINEKQKRKVEERGYIYIGTYERNEKLLDGRVLGVDVDREYKKSYVKIRCPYCNTEYDTWIVSFVNRKYNCKFCCNEYKNSFAHHIQVELGESLDKYWDWEKNTQNPYLIAKNQHGNNRNGKNLKVWIKCTEKDYHGSYEMACDHFVKGYRCPYCVNQHGKVHPKDSFGSLYPQYAKYWSDKNEVSPFEVTPHSAKKFWFNCEKCNTLFMRKIIDITKKGTCRGVTCKKCSSSQGERKIKQIFDSNGLIEGVDYIHDKTYFKDLKGKSGYLLRPDFVLPKSRIWIEFDGIQHKEYKEGFHQSYESYIVTKENDEIKNKYAKENNWKLIRINQCDFKNIDEIINNLLNI